MRQALRHANSRTLAPPQASARGRAQVAWQEGQAHAKRGAWEQATRSFARAAQHDPRDAVIALNLARALLAQSRCDEAAEAAARAYNLDPRSPLACAYTAHCLMEGKRFRDAARCLQSLPEGMERGLDYWSTLARALQHSHQPKEAIDAYLRALAFNLTDTTLHYQLGLCFNELSMKTEAAQCLETALALDAGPYELGIRGLLTYFARDACHWATADDSLAQLQQTLHALDDGLTLSTTPFAHVTLQEDPHEQLKAARMLARWVAQRALAMTPRASDWRPGGARRLRVGYVSADFHQHATCILMAEMLEQHDRERFEVTLYSHGKDDGTPLRKRIQAACEHFVDLREATDREAAERIRADGCDLLIDLKGYTANNRFAIFAWRPAPVSASFLGFPGTTGADYIDYFIGDPVVTPLADQACYSEQIAQMPVCYQPNDRQRPLPALPQRADEDLPADALVLAGFNQPYKISSQVFDTWCTLLHDLPQAVLWLLEWNEQSRSHIQREAQARGIDPARIVWAGRKLPAEHMARMQLADIFLDTWPCNAHTTASDALWAGVPVVTFPGRSFASRVAASLNRAVGMGELVGADRDDYLRIVRALAADPERRAALRQRLLQARSDSPLFDSLRFVRDFEALLLRMMQRHVEGLPPAPLPALQP